MRRKVAVLGADQRHPELDALWALITEAGAMQWKSATLTEMITVGLGIKCRASLRREWLGLRGGRK